MEFVNAFRDLKLFGGAHAWITQSFIVVFTTLLIAFLQKLFLKRLSVRLTQNRFAWDDAIVDALRGPLTLLISLVGITFAAEIVATGTNTPLFGAAVPIRSVGVIIAIAWFLIRLIRAGEEKIIARSKMKGEEIDRTTADAIGKLLRISVIVTTGLVMLQTLGFSVSGVLAFGGVGGLAIGFAAKDLLANFFGGLMVYLDRPFVVGDWVRSPDRQIEGTVEKIGWRLCVIRTFDKRPLYVPNSTFATIALENPSRMSHRRIFETIGVRYDDAPVLKDILAGVRTMLAEHEEIAQDQLIMVYFNEYAASSLDFFIYCFTRTTVWSEYHRVKEDVLLKIMDIIVAHGAQVAFPTTTLDLPDGAFKEDALNKELSRAHAPSAGLTTQRA